MSNSSFKIIIFSLIFAFFLIGCDQLKEGSIEKTIYLLPQLHGKDIHSIELKSKEGHSLLVRKKTNGGYQTLQIFQQIPVSLERFCKT